MIRFIQKYTRRLTQSMLNLTFIILWFSQSVIFYLKYIDCHLQQDTCSNLRNKNARRCSSLKQPPPPNGNTDFKSPTSASIDENAATKGNYTSINMMASPVVGGGTTAPKRPKWEVIEHFRSHENGMDSVSSSLIAVWSHFYLRTFLTSFLVHCSKYERKIRYYGFRSVYV